MLINPRNLCMGIISVLVVCGAACVDTAMMFHGQTITSVPVVALEDGVKNAGTWETFDLVINYTLIVAQPGHLVGDVHHAGSFLATADQPDTYRTSFRFEALQVV